MNKKGMTLVEIIISIALISIVLLFLFSLLINVKDINEEGEINSSYLIMKALVIKNIEEDLDKIDGALTIKPCEYTGGVRIQQIYSGWTNVSNKNNWLCLNLNYKENIINDDGSITLSDEINHLIGIYYYEPQNNYVISYIKENGTKITRLLDNFDPSLIKYKNNSGSNETKLGLVFNSSSSGSGFLNIYIPLVGTDHKDYSLNIPFYGDFTINTGTYYSNS